MKPDTKKSLKRTEFSGAIRYVSISPHGDPEGIVLDDGSFVKVPPHSLIQKDLFKVGPVVSGYGEVMTKSPNRMFHHAKVEQNNVVWADDSVGESVRSGLKEQHQIDLKSYKTVTSEKVKLSGKIVAAGSKPNGEVNRLIFDDGTSVHIPKELELSGKKVHVGDSYEVKGEIRMFGKLRFVKASSPDISSESRHLDFFDENFLA